jgi:hypothetical protein
MQERTADCIVFSLVVIMIGSVLSTLIFCSHYYGGKDTQKRLSVIEEAVKNHADYQTIRVIVADSTNNSIQP